jgi:hypothetical protein
MHESRPLMSPGEKPSTHRFSENQIQLTFLPGSLMAIIWALVVYE